MNHHLQVLSENINESEIIYYSGLIVESLNGRVKKKERHVNGIKNFDEICLASIHSQQVCIPATIAKNHKYNPNFKVGEDLELWLRINDEFPFIYIEEAFHVILVDHDERTVNLKYSNSPLEQMKTLSHIFNIKHPGYLTSNIIKNQKLSNCYFNMAKHHMLNKNFSRGILMILKSLVQQPKNELTKHKLYCVFSLFTMRIPKEYNS